MHDSLNNCSAYEPTKCSKVMVHLVYHRCHQRGTTGKKGRRENEDEREEKEIKEKEKQEEGQLEDHFPNVPVP